MTLLPGIDFDDLDDRADARLEYMAERAEIAREESRPPRTGLEPGWKRCECGTASPHPYCPACRTRLRPPGSALEVQWMRNFGYEPTPTDLRRFPDDRQGVL
jgi:hypothetical protein